jgi:hypothetical protein
LNITDQVEGADLAAAIREEFVAANRTLNDLVNVVGRLGLAVNLSTSVVSEFAQDDPRAGKLAKLSERLRLAARMGIDVDKHGSPPFETICSHRENSHSPGANPQPLGCF